VLWLWACSKTDAATLDRFFEGPVQASSYLIGMATRVIIFVHKATEISYPWKDFFDVNCQVIM